LKDIVAFVGPSISLAAAEKIAPFDYRPPAAQGDVYLAVRAGARAIGLIDGFFEGVPAVWHKELLYALSSGVHVFGASSMGALRAAELHSYGMRGVGQIFQWFASGLLDADDEVALVHGPAEVGYIALSLPLVNVRATLDAAVQTGAFQASTAQQLLRAARSIHFKNRTWKQILDVAGQDRTARDASWQWLSANAVDQKRLDACTMIEAMADLATAWPGPFRPGFVFEPTDAWTAGVAAFEADTAISRFDRLVVDEARVGGADFEPLLSAATSAVLATSGRDGAAAPGFASRRLDTFRKNNGLVDRGVFEAWLARNQLDGRELGKHLARRASVATIVDRFNNQLVSELIVEIKLRGLYPRLSERASRKMKTLSGSQSNLGPTHVSRQFLIEWFFENRLGRKAPDDLDDARRNLALPDIAALQELIEREYLTTRLEGKD
jgi:hypothetical protein